MNFVVNLLGLYVLLGAIFSIAFLWKGIDKIDQNAKDSHWTFKALTVPGTIALWPILLRKWLQHS